MMCFDYWSVKYKDPETRKKEKGLAKHKAKCVKNRKKRKGSRRKKT